MKKIDFETFKNKFINHNKIKFNSKLYKGKIPYIRLKLIQLCFNISLSYLSNQQKSLLDKNQYFIEESLYGYLKKIPFKKNYKYKKNKIYAHCWDSVDDTSTNTKFASWDFESPQIIFSQFLGEDHYKNWCETRTKKETKKGKFITKGKNFDEHFSKDGAFSYIDWKPGSVKDMSSSHSANNVKDCYALVGVGFFKKITKETEYEVYDSGYIPKQYEVYNTHLRRIFDELMFQFSLPKSIRRLP